MVMRTLVSLETRRATSRSHASPLETRNVSSQQISPSMPMQAWPKVELHRHLEGSIRLDTMLDIIKKEALDLPQDRAVLSRLVQVQPDDPRDATSFLSKFTTIRQFFRSRAVIERITREAIDDAAADNIRYMEVRFTPVALSRINQAPLGDVMDWVCAAAKEAAARHRMTVRLIASTNRHEAVELAAEVGSLAAARQHNGIVGLDLAGNEAASPMQPFLPVFQRARQAGLAITLHAGEWAGPENVRVAIDDFGARRIGHGVRVLEDAAITALARERGTMFEVCVTSNCQTGVVRTPAEHPFRRMRQSGLKASLHTDDPALSQLTLSTEYQLAAASLGLTHAELKQSIIDAAEAAFLPASETSKLVAALRAELGMTWFNRIRSRVGF
jgi:adenosine deaminase